MPETDPSANEKCDQGRREPRRRWRLTLCALLLPPVWLGGEQALRTWSQATSPVVSVAEEGNVSIRGKALRLGADALPPAVLADLEGGPPVELAAKHEKPEPGCTDFCIRTFVTRTWHYPHLGLTVQIRRKPYGDGSGKAFYHGWLKFGTDHPGTVEVRGQRLWMGRSTTFNPALRKEGLIPLLREEDSPAYMDDWSLSVGGTYVDMVFAHNYDYNPGRLEELCYVLGINLNPNLNNPRLKELYVGLPSPDNFDSAAWPAEHVVDAVEPIPGREMPDFMKPTPIKQSPVKTSGG